MIEAIVAFAPDVDQAAPFRRLFFRARSPISGFFLAVYFDCVFFLGFVGTSLIG